MEIFYLTWLKWSMIEGEWNTNEVSSACTCRMDLEESRECSVSAVCSLETVSECKKSIRLWNRLFLIVFSYSLY